MTSTKHKGFAMIGKSYTLAGIRVFVQSISAVILTQYAIYGIFRCPFMVPYTSCTHCPVLQCPGKKMFLPLWIAIITTALFFSRSFCGWLCPIGSLTDIFSKINPMKIKIKDKTSAFLSNGKYLVLFAALFYMVTQFNPRLAIPIRTGQFFQSIQLTFAHAHPLWIARTIFIIVGILLSIVISKFWCRFVCPAGGLMGILSNISVFGINKKENCTTCSICKDRCKTNTYPNQDNCVSCFSCLRRCKKDALFIDTKIGKKKDVQKTA